MQDFSFYSDFKNINWSDTVMYNFLRGTSAGLIIGFIVALNTVQASGMGLSITQILMTILSFVFVIPVMLLVFFIPYNLLLGLFKNHTGDGAMFVLRIISIIFAIIPAIGDPLIRVLLNYYPDLIDIEKPAWFQRKVIVFILS